MPIQAIDINSVRKQSSQAPKVSSMPGFADVLDAANPAISTAVSWDQGATKGSATSVAISGLSGASRTMTQPSMAMANGPYYGGTTAAGAMTVNASSTGLTVGTNISYPGQGLPAFPASGIPADGLTGINNPSSDYLEKQALFQQMNDANWEMLVAQVTVNNLSRDYQAHSNILKTKSDTEVNSVRNFKS